MKEIQRVTSEGVYVVFDGIGGPHMWRSRKALRPGGKVVVYGLTSSLSGGRLASGRRHRFHGIAIYGLYIAGGWLIPGRKRVVPYSIQWLKRLRPALFRQDLITRGVFFARMGCLRSQSGVAAYSNRPTAYSGKQSAARTRNSIGQSSHGARSLIPIHFAHS